WRRAREASVGQKRDRVAQSRSDNGGGDREHFAHPGASRRTLVADDHDVARLDGLMLDRLERLLLAVEHACRASVARALGARQLEDGTLRGQVAEENDESSVGL